MRGGRLSAVLFSAALAIPVVVFGSPAEAQAPSFARCPVAKAAANRPKAPAPPKPDATQLRVGGEGLATSGLTVPKGAPALPRTLSATYWVVADLGTGKVLGACGPHEYATPASVQKLLLAATVMPKLRAKQQVKVTRGDLNFEPGSSAVGLLEGGKYSVETLWLGLLLNSGNDAANVLARLGSPGQGVAGTVKAMNAEANRLGANQTHAVTPSGLDGPGQFTSAYDLALIARQCFARADFRKYVAAKRARIPAQPGAKVKGFEIQNHNRLVFEYPGALGGKTGFTQLARHTYVGAAQRGGRQLVVTILGAEAQPARPWQQGISLLNWGFSLPASASVGELVKPTTVPAAKPSPTAAAVARAAAIPRSATATPASMWSPGTVAGLAVAVAAVPLTVAVAARRQRRTIGRRRIG